MRVLCFVSVYDQTTVISTCHTGAQFYQLQRYDKRANNDFFHTCIFFFLSFFSSRPPTQKIAMLCCCGFCEMKTSSVLNTAMFYSNSATFSRHRFVVDTKKNQCNAPCNGKGTRYRLLHCVWYGTRKPAGNACNNQPRPAVMKTCSGPPCIVDDREYMLLFLLDFVFGVPTVKIRKRVEILVIFTSFIR